MYRTVIRVQLYRKCLARKGKLIKSFRMNVQILHLRHEAWQSVQEWNGWKQPTKKWKMNQLENAALLNLKIHFHEK